MSIKVTAETGVRPTFNLTVSIVGRRFLFLCDQKVEERTFDSSAVLPGGGVLCLLKVNFPGEVLNARRFWQVNSVTVDLSCRCNFAPRTNSTLSGAEPCVCCGANDCTLFALRNTSDPAEWDKWFVHRSTWLWTAPPMWVSLWKIRPILGVCR